MIDSGLAGVVNVGHDGWVVVVSPEKGGGGAQREAGARPVFAGFDNDDFVCSVFYYFVARFVGRSKNRLYICTFQYFISWPPFPPHHHHHRNSLSPPTLPSPSPPTQKEYSRDYPYHYNYKSAYKSA
jgi:hypothetical protein